MENWSIGKAATLTDLVMCINKYRIQTVGLYTCINVSVKLGNIFVNPDFMVTICKGRHKQCTPDFEKDYFMGAPNFILEIHNDANSQFVKDRKELFVSAGVQEYVIVNEQSNKVEWNRLVKGKLFKKNTFEIIEPNENGVIKSSSLPGLWIPIDAVKKRNNWAIMACIDEGVTRREHQELMSTIWNNN